MLSSGVLYATFEFRSPLSVRDGMMHWPFLAPIHEAWWYDMMPNDKEDSKWNIYTWSAAYYRCSDKAFFNVEKNKNTRKTTKLSTLFFGKDSFRGEEAFAGGMITDTVLLAQTNAFLGFARITPRFDYNEYGAFWGLHVDRRFGEEEKWHAGGKISVPFKVIEIEQDSNCKLEETIGDVVRLRQVNLDVSGINTGRSEFAARLDFVNTLIRNNAPLVQFPGDAVNIAGQRVNGTGADETGQVPGAYITKRDNGELPQAPFRKRFAQVAGPLGVDGSGADGSTLFFQTGTDYQNNLFKDRDAQGKLFLVSRRVNPTGAAPNGDDVTSESDAIRVDLSNQLFVLSSLSSDEKASEFFRARDIDLCAHERITAIGDIETEVYCGYGHRNDWFIDGILGVRLPSGKKNKDPGKLFFQSTGHNRHFEIKLGLDGGWMPREWFAFKIDASFHHAFRRTEKRAALFKGATVRNTGPEIVRH